MFINKCKDTKFARISDKFSIKFLLKKDIRAPKKQFREMYVNFFLAPLSYFKICINHKKFIISPKYSAKRRFLNVIDVRNNSLSVNHIQDWRAKLAHNKRLLKS